MFYSIFLIIREDKQVQVYRYINVLENFYSKQEFDKDC